MTATPVTAIATALARDGATPFTLAGRTALQKILAALHTVEAENARSLATRIRLFDDVRETPRPPAVVEHAIVQRRVLELDYVDKDGRPTRRAVEPVAVLGVHPNWYLWAWCRMREAPRAFRLDRIRGAVMYDEVAPDRGLDPADIEVPDLIGRGILGS
jgi:predicted DNA-binding transcriptional regulator YafY